jgi:hypothetical protein
VIKDCHIRRNAAFFDFLCYLLNSFAGLDIPAGVVVSNPPSRNCCRSETLYFRNSERLFPKSGRIFQAIFGEFYPGMPDTIIMMLSNSASDKIPVPLRRSFSLGKSSAAQKRIGILFS